MPHQRTLIRHAVLDLLLGATAAGQRVQTDRVDPYRLSELPAVAIYTPDENIDPKSKTTAPRELERDLTLRIEGWVASGAGMNDAMDDLALEIETALAADPQLHDMAGDTILEGTTLGPSGEGERAMGLVTLSYRVTYNTLAPEPPVSLDEFLTAGVVTSLGGVVHEDEVARDEIAVRGTGS